MALLHNFPYFINDKGDFFLTLRTKYGAKKIKKI